MSAQTASEMNYGWRIVQIFWDWELKVITALKLSTKREKVSLSGNPIA